jgi:hypothetical protein
VRSALRTVSAGEPLERELELLVDELDELAVDGLADELGELWPVRLDERGDAPLEGRRRRARQLAESTTRRRESTTFSCAVTASPLHAQQTQRTSSDQHLRPTLSTLGEQVERQGGVPGILDSDVMDVHPTASVPVGTRAADNGDVGDEGAVGEIDEPLGHDLATR